MDSESPKNITNKAYYNNYIQGVGNMGKAFKNYYNGIIKMGDTPSLTYVMNGNPDDPLSESWGGNFTSNVLNYPMLPEEPKSSAYFSDGNSS